LFENRSLEERSESGQFSLLARRKRNHKEIVSSAFRGLRG
jgi:hypothetical protein